MSTENKIWFEFKSVEGVGLESNHFTHLFSKDIGDAIDKKSFANGWAHPQPDGLLMIIVKKPIRERKVKFRMPQLVWCSGV